MGNFPFLDVSRILFASCRVIPDEAVVNSFFGVIIVLNKSQDDCNKNNNTLYTITQDVIMNEQGTIRISIVQWHKCVHVV